MPKLTYVLVHDIGSGAWVWKKVIRSLISRGHDAIALDLKASGDNPTNIKDVKDLMDYAEPLLDYLARQRSQVILVAHGYGGVSATLAMKLHPTKISSVIYLNAFMPNDKGDPNPNLKEFLNTFRGWGDTNIEHASNGDIYTFGQNFIKGTICPYAATEDQKDAVEYTRPGIFFQGNDPFPMTVPVYAIICTGDKFLSEKFQKEEARKLGIDGTPFNDADHSPMISLPIELCDIIVKQGRSDV